MKMTEHKIWDGTDWKNTNTIKKFNGSTWDTLKIYHWESPYSYSIPWGGSWTVNSLIYNTHPDGFETRASSALSSGENFNCTNVFMSWFSQGGVRWMTSSTSTGWVAIKMPSEVYLDSYYIYTHDDVPSRAPKNWTVQGSNDSTNGNDGTWVTIDTQTDIPEHTQTTINVNSTKLYKWFRINITANWGFSSGVSLMDFIPHVSSNGWV